MSEPTPEPEAREATGESAAQDALRRLEARLAQASEAAERLIGEAAETIAGPRAEAAETVAGPRGEPAAGPGAESPPAAGWQEPRAKRPDAGADLELLGEVLRRLRDLVPPDLQRRLAEAVRELLLALRALIDWYLDRIERRRAEPPQMTDIPIL